jgi:hypothetical protein
MGSTESTRRCPRCNIELLESNMVEHLRTCVKMQASGQPNGAWEVTYSGSDTGVTSMAEAITSTSQQAFQYKK